MQKDAFLSCVTTAFLPEDAYGNMPFVALRILAISLDVISARRLTFLSAWRGTSRLVSSFSFRYCGGDLRRSAVAPSTASSTAAATTPSTGASAS